MFRRSSFPDFISCCPLVSKLPCCLAPHNKIASLFYVHKVTTSIFPHLAKPSRFLSIQLFRLLSPHFGPDLYVFSRLLKNPSIVIASEAKQSQNMLIIHKIATSRHASLAAKGSLAPRNDQNWPKMRIVQSSQPGSKSSEKLCKCANQRAVAQKRFCGISRQYRGIVRT